MDDFSPRSLKLLGRALEAALRDKVAEVHTPDRTQIYCDADIVIGAVYPFHSMSVSAPGAMSPIANVVRSMWTAGHLTSVGMLWPHLAEFHRAIQKEREQPSQKYLRAYSDRTHIPKLRAALTGKPEAVLEVAQNFLGVDEYVAIWASQYRTLAERLVALGDHLDLSMDAGDGLRGVVDATMTQSLAQRILAVRHGSRSFLGLLNQWITGQESLRTRNALSDAIALLTVARFALDQRNSHRRIRFITSAEALFEACDIQSWVRAGKDADPAGDDFILRSSTRDDPDGPMRSMEYMYLRGVVPSLAFQRVGSAAGKVTSEYSSWDLDDLRETVSVIKYVLHPDWDPSLGDLNTVGRKLYDDIHRGSAALFFRKVWMAGMSNESVIDALGSFNVQTDEMVSELTSEAGRSRVDQLNQLQFGRLTQEISRQVMQLENHWFDRLSFGPSATSDSFDPLINSGCGRWLACFDAKAVDEWRELIGDADQSSGIEDVPTEVPRSASAARATLAKLLVLDMRQTAVGANAILSLKEQLERSAHGEPYRFTAMFLVHRARLTMATVGLGEAPDGGLSAFRDLELSCREISERVPLISQDLQARARMYVACAWLLFQIAIERQHRFKGRFLGQADSVSEEGMMYSQARSLLGRAAGDLDQRSRELGLARAIDLITAVPIQGGAPLFPLLTGTEIDTSNPYYADAVTWWRVARQNRLARALDRTFISEEIVPQLEQLEEGQRRALSHERYWKYHIEWYRLAQAAEDAGR